MMAKWSRLEGASVLVAGCGVGIYAQQIRQRYTVAVDGFDIELNRVSAARKIIPNALVCAGEHIPYRDNTFDTVLSHEVIEHVKDDRCSVAEMVRVLKPGGRLLLFCPNRWYPFETHGHYWRDEYHFGNTPFINYLPNGLRDRLAPHVRAYSSRGSYTALPRCPGRNRAPLADLCPRLRQYHRAYRQTGSYPARLALSPGKYAARYLGIVSFPGCAEALISLCR